MLLSDRRMEILCVEPRGLDAVKLGPECPKQSCHLLIFVSLEGVRAKIQGEHHPSL